MVVASGQPPKANITIGPYTALILSQVPPQPILTIARTNQVLTVAWQIPPAGWTLYSAPSLAGKITWSQVPPAQYQTNGATVYVNVTAPNGAVFYRMQE
jgi:hypothetical protein